MDAAVLFNLVSLLQEVENSMLWNLHSLTSYFVYLYGMAMWVVTQSEES